MLEVIQNKNRGYNMLYPLFLFVTISKSNQFFFIFLSFVKWRTSVKNGKILNKNKL
jgi:hypothetical protein